MPEPFSERVPPSNLEAEVSVLGAMLHDNQVIARVQPILRTDDFYFGRHGELYSAILATASKYGQVDVTTLSNHLSTQKPLDPGDENLLASIGGMTALFNLMNQVPSSANAESYARIVEEKATLRRLQTAARRIVDETYVADDASQAIARAEAGIQRVAVNRQGVAELRDLAGVGDWLRQYAQSTDDDLLPTGFEDLDLKLEIRRRQVHALMGPPKMGKSAVARQIALNQAEDGLHVLFFSLEEDEAAQRMNFTAMKGGVKKEDLRRKVLKPGDLKWHSVEHAAKILDSLPLRFDFTSLQDITLIASKIRYHALTWGVDVAIIDTLNAVDEDRKRDERGDERMTRMVRVLEAVAKETECAIIVVVQGKQDILISNSYWLTPMHVADSRGMVQALTSVIGVMRPEKVINKESAIYYAGKKLTANDPRWKRVMALFIVASRYGVENEIVPLFANMSSGQISNLAPEYWPWNVKEQKAQTDQDNGQRARKRGEPRPPRRPAPLDSF